MDDLCPLLFCKYTLYSHITFDNFKRIKWNGITEWKSTRTRSENIKKQISLTRKQLFLINRTCKKYIIHILKFTFVSHLKEIRICHPKIYHFGIRIILSWRHLKNSKHKERLSLNSPYLPKDRSSKNTSTVINPGQGSFINQERLTFITEEEIRSWHHSHRHFVTN